MGRKAKYDKEIREKRGPGRKTRKQKEPWFPKALQDTDESKTLSHRQVQRVKKRLSKQKTKILKTMPKAKKKEIQSNEEKEEEESEPENSNFHIMPSKRMKPSMGFSDDSSSWLTPNKPLKNGLNVKEKEEESDSDVEQEDETIEEEEGEDNSIEEEDESVDEMEEEDENEESGEEEGEADVSLLKGFSDDNSSWLSPKKPLKNGRNVKEEREEESDSDVEQEDETIEEEEGEDNGAEEEDESVDEMESEDEDENEESGGEEGEADVSLLKDMVVEDSSSDSDLEDDKFDPKGMKDGSEDSDEDLLPIEKSNKKLKLKQEKDAKLAEEELQLNISSQEKFAFPQGTEEENLQSCQVICTLMKYIENKEW